MRQFNGRPFVAAGGALLLLLAGGCSRVQEHQGFIIEPLIVGSVLPGVDNKASVQGAMGRPSFVSQFGPERWYYVSRTTKQLSFGTPRPIAQNLYVIEFDNAGNVAQVLNDPTLNNVARISPVGDKTETAGRKRSLFDEIFGNIGTVGAGPMGSAPSGPGPNGS
ncbi:MAG TPA: outer membrane protein assembly factor BamE [Sphingobium sp.]|nr:outer membrane protein assembly factor BamE [Sphingobium sp.]